MGSCSLPRPKGSLSETFPRRDVEKNPLEPIKKKKIQTAKHSDFVLCQVSLLFFLPDCLPTNAQIIPERDTGSFSLQHSFHRESGDQADGKIKRSGIAL